MTTTDTRPATRRPGLTATAILTASAVLLAALTIIQAGRLPFNAAYAGTANQGGQGTSVVTIDSGLGPKERRSFVQGSSDPILAGSQGRRGGGDR